jgi:hypothetical protein
MNILQKAHKNALKSITWVGEGIAAVIYQDSHVSLLHANGSVTTLIQEQIEHGLHVLIATRGAERVELAKSGSPLEIAAILYALHDASQRSSNCWKTSRWLIGGLSGVILLVASLLSYEIGLHQTARDIEPLIAMMNQGVSPGINFMPPSGPSFVMPHQGSTDNEIGSPLAAPPNNTHPDSPQISGSINPQSQVPGNNTAPSILSNRAEQPPINSTAISPGVRMSPEEARRIHDVLLRIKNGLDRGHVASAEDLAQLPEYLRRLYIQPAITLPASPLSNTRHMDVPAMSSPVDLRRPYPQSVTPPVSPPSNTNPMDAPAMSSPVDTSVKSEKDRIGVPYVPSVDLWNNGSVNIPLPGGGDITSPDDLKSFGLPPY